MPSPTTSLPAVSLPPEPGPGGITLAAFTPDDDTTALELERACFQGVSVRMVFRRDRFALRAERFAVHRILTARHSGRLVGVAAAAIKEVEYLGKPSRAAFFFDFRISPEHRGFGIGRRLAGALLEWSTPLSDLAYTYAVEGNGAAERIGDLFGTRAGGYVYLVYPCLRSGRREANLTAAHAAEVHAAARERCGPFDFYANPFVEGRTGWHVGSWLLRGPSGLSGCSASSARGVLEEVVVALPPSLRAVRALQAAGLIGRSWPRLPETGEALRSWYLFDFFAPDGATARSLLRAVAAEARARGVDWVYLPHAAGDSRVLHVRADVPRVLAPILGYGLFIRHNDFSRPTPVRRLYVDVRDL